MKYTKKTENRKENMPSGVSVMCEVTEWRDKDGYLAPDSEKKLAPIRVISDVGYYTYLALIDRYSQGLISMETLDTILIGDNLQRFVKPGDIKRDENTNAQYEKTVAYEKKWEASMLVRRTNPGAWGFALNEIVGDIFK